MRSLWGVGPAGPIHFGYDTAALAQKGIIDEGGNHSILFADLHLMMSHGLSYNDARRRAAYYEAVFSEGYGLRAKFVRGSDFQVSSDYVAMLLSSSRGVSIPQLLKTLAAPTQGSSKTNRPLSSVLYSLMQCLDAVYLEAETVLADWGQKKIYDLLTDPKALGEKIPALIELRASLSSRGVPASYRYYPLMVDTAGKRLNESSSQTRISIHESPENILKKVKTMYAPPPGQTESTGRQNALLQYIEFSALPWVSLPVTVTTRNGAVMCDSMDDVKKFYDSGAVHPSDLKQFLGEVLIDRAKEVRNKLATAAYGWIDPQLLNPK